MKEAFTCYHPKNRTRKLFEEINEAFEYLSTPRQRVTTLQIFWYLVRKGSIQRDPRSNDFHKTFRSGLYGGFLDWRIRASRPYPPVFRDADSPVELWARCYHLANWVIDTAERHDLPLVLDTKYRFQDQAFWLAANRLYPRVETERVTILYLADGKETREQTFRDMKEAVHNMLRVRLVRNTFNSLVGQELWTPEGVYLPEKPGLYMDALTDAKDEADRTLKSNFRVINIGLSPDKCQGLEDSRRMLHMVDPQELKKVVDGAVYRARASSR